MQGINKKSGNTLLKVAAESHHRLLKANKTIHLMNRLLHRFAKTVSILIIVLVFLVGSVRAQAPNISYASGTKNLVVGTQMDSLIPTNTGGSLNYGLVTTLAGSITSGSTDGTGVLASFYNPEGEVVDANGDLYVVDSKNNKIRKITATGVVTTFAGSGAAGSANGTGIAATFNNPRGIAIDASGNIYVADSKNNQIRKISSSGDVTTLAGSGSAGSVDATGTLASFNNPLALAVDAANNVYVADLGNNKIRKINSSGVVTTFAGNGNYDYIEGPSSTASFNKPRGVAVDGAGNVYVADANNGAIRKINAISGVVSTYGSQYSVGTPIGLVMDASGNLYVSGTYAIYKIKPSPSFEVTTLDTSIHSATGLAVNNAGSILYVANKFYNTIKKVEIIGEYSITPSLPSGLTFDTKTGVITGTPTVKSTATNYTVNVSNAAGSSSAIISIATVALQPTISSISINTGSTGDVMQINGKHFTTLKSVSFGGSAAYSFILDDDSTITAVINTGSSGNVSITTDGGTASLAGFTYVTLPNYTWTGLHDSDWNNADNWSNNVLPNSSKSITVGDTKSRFPYLTTNLTIGVMDLDGIIFLNGNTLTLTGAVSGTGHFNTDINSSIIVNGTVGDLIFYGQSYIKDLTFANGSASLGGDGLILTGVFKLTGGTLNTNGKLLLDNSSHAIVYYPITGTINGNVGVYNVVGLSGKNFAAFRDLGVAVTGATVNDLNNNLNIGAYSYSNGSWSSLLSSGTSLVPGSGYRAQFEAGVTGFSTGGTLVTTSVSPAITQGANAYSFVANPYIGQLDFTKLTTSNLQAGFWYLDPTYLSSDGYQGYVYYGTLTGASNSYSGGLSLTKYIQPSQGFFVQNQNNSSTSSLTFSTSAIDNTLQQNYVFGTQALNKIATGLFINGKNVDGAVVVFNSVFADGLDKNDAAKFSNRGENLTFSVAGKDYCTNAWSMPTATDELPMHLYNLKASTAYTLKLDASQFVGNGLEAYLQDKVTNTKTLLVGANNEVTFTTGTDAATFANRYSIVFGASALPVRNISLTASALHNSQVAVKWSTIGESNIASYKIERSTNGTSYTELATVSPSTSHSYSYIDATPSGAGVYFRIKVIDNTGTVSYSNIVFVSTVYRQPLTVYPNPVTGRSFNIGLGNTGKYTVNVVNQLGQKVYSTVVNHTNGNLETVAMAKQLAAGNYHLTVVGEDGKTNTTTLTIK